jgi:hypothetical protein
MAVKATTFRLKEDVQTALVSLSETVGRPLNALVNEAVELYLDQRVPEVTSELEITLAKLRGYQKQDPRFEQSIEASVQAESRYLDPAEGRVVKLKKHSAPRKARRPAHA